MELSTQELFNAAFTIVTLVLGWVLRVVWDAIADLQRNDREIAKDITDIKEIVAGKYVTREELQGYFNRMDTKLSDIQAQLRGKVDK